MPILIFIQQFKILQEKVRGIKPVYYITDGSLGVCPGLTEEDCLLVTLKQVTKILVIVRRMQW